MLPTRRIPTKQKAVIGWLANDDTPTEAHGELNSLSDVAQEVIERIKKCFARASHANSNENEARAAVKMASKIMEQHNINQADLMEHEDQKSRAARAGMSTVNILPAKEDGFARAQTWVLDLVSAVRVFFSCDAYSTMLPDMIEWTFFGVLEHTVSAAIAFEMIHNLIQEWAGSYTTIATRNSYSLGVAEGLCRLAEKEEAAMEEAAKSNEAKALAARIRDEEIQQQKAFDRLRDPTPLPPSPSPSPSPRSSPEPIAEPGGESSNVPKPGGFHSDGESDNEAMPDFNEEHKVTLVDTGADFDLELRKFIILDSKHEQHHVASADSKPEHDQAADQGSQLSCAEHKGQHSSSPCKQEHHEMEETAEWKSMRQLTVFRQNLKDLQDSFLEAKGVKLGKGKKRKRSVKDREIFRQGRKDARKINVKAARIEEEKA